MSGEQPSGRQIEARRAQSEADRTGRGKDAASRKQAEADRLDQRKH
ncbi:hypothetical protein J31TS4_33610 [Paenibacillus sp. J31TS4]|nr:hypothetical protein [Paenibacillus sp. J31TS4]GIP40081.1 hypothetical protein J31TS4_33610 [Paenibacillus sp. J31TS4]